MHTCFDRVFVQSIMYKSLFFCKKAPGDIGLQSQGLFQLFWEKAPGLNWGKICGIFGLFWEFFQKCKLLDSKKKHLNMCMIMMILIMCI